MNYRIIGLAISLAVLMGFTGRAEAGIVTLTYNIDFVLVNPTAQNVTGELIGLTEKTYGDDTTFAPTGLDIFTGPGVSSPVTETFNNGSAIGTGFTITSGVITAADFDNQFSDSNGSAAFNYGGTNGISYTPYSLDVVNMEDFGGVEYGTLGAMVPEPSQYGIFFALASACFVAWRRFSARSL